MSMISEELNKSANQQAFSRDTLTSAPDTFEHANSEEEFLNSGRQAIKLQQREMGFSDFIPLGTIDINNCIAIALRDTETGMVGLAHFDAHSDPNSLNKLFERTGAGPYEAIIVGARFSPDGGHGNWERETTEQNLNSVLSALQSHDVHITSAKIYGDEQPRNIIIDPIDFSITPVARESAAFLEDTQEVNMLSLARIFLGETHPPMEIAFDSRLGSEKLPLMLEEAQITTIKNHVLDKSDTEIEQWVVGNGAQGEMIPVIREALKVYAELYTEQVDRLHAMGVSESIPLYIGDGASEMNDSVHLAREESQTSSFSSFAKN